MALVFRQTALYKFRASLYRPTPISFQVAGSNAMLDANAMKDIGYDPSPAYTNVPCYFKSASEVAGNMPAGLQSESNQFTYYVWDFDAAQEIDNTWAIELTTPNHPNTGDFFFVADVPKVTSSSGLRTVNRTQVFAKRGDKPNGVP